MEKPQNEKIMIDFLETLNIAYKKIANSWGFGENEVKHCNYLFAQCFNLLENMVQKRGRKNV